MLFAEVQPVLAQILCKVTNFPWKLVTEDAFFSHFYRFNHIILHERRRIPEKRAATGAVKVQIAAIRPRRARFLPGFLQSDCDWWQSDLGFLKSEVVWSRSARNLSNPSKSDILFLIYLCSICSDLWDFCPTRALRESLREKSLKSFQI